MKPGKQCKASGKRAFASHEAGVAAGMRIFSRSQTVREFSVYHCAHCKCWHLTTHGWYRI